MKIMAVIGYAAVLFSELYVLEKVGVAPGTRYWWALVLGYIVVTWYGAIIGGK